MMSWLLRYQGLWQEQLQTCTRCMRGCCGLPDLACTQWLNWVSGGAPANPGEQLVERLRPATWAQ